MRLQAQKKNKSSKCSAKSLKEIVLVHFEFKSGYFWTQLGFFCTCCSLFWSFILFCAIIEISLILIHAEKNEVLIHDRNWNLKFKNQCPRCKVNFCEVVFVIENKVFIADIFSHEAYLISHILYCSGNEIPMIRTWFSNVQDIKFGSLKPIFWICGSRIRYCSENEIPIISEHDFPMCRILLWAKTKVNF